MKSDCLLIQQASGPHIYLLNLTVKDHADYCRRHIIDFWPVYGDVETGKHAFFAKVALLKRGFDAGYRKVIWLDSDCYIADVDRDLRDACPEDGFGLVWHGKEKWVEGPECYNHFNVGAIYAGVGTEAERLLKIWLKSKDDGHTWHDQHAFNKHAIPDYEALFRKPAPVKRLGYEWNAVPFKEFAHERPVVAAWHGYQVDITLRAEAMQQFIQQNKMRILLAGCDVNEARQKADYCLHVGNFEGAAQFFRRAEELGAGETAEFYYSYAFAFTKQGKHGEAIPVIQKGLEIEPDNGLSWQLLGTCYDFIGEHEKNGQAIAKAMEYSPNFPPLMHNLSLWQMRDGQWRDGFKNMEWSFLCRERIARYPGAEWKGVHDHYSDSYFNVLVWAEQGLGDTVMLSRYVAGLLLGEPGTCIIWEVQQSVAELLKAQCWPNVEVIARPEDNSLPWDFDQHIGMFTLPKMLGVTVENTTGKPYLKAPDDKVLEWKDRLHFSDIYTCEETYTSQGAYKPFRVGFSWAGSQQHGNNANRNARAELFDDLVKTPDIRWYSLQRGIVISDEVKADTPEVTWIGDDFADMADTAGALANLDLVITIDSAIAHLCGAMGIPCFVLLSKSADWRWLTEGDTTVWYDTLTLFRQSELGDWGGVMERVTAAFQEFRK